MRQRAVRPGRVRAALRRLSVEHVRAVEAGAGQGRQGGDLPSPPWAHMAEEAGARTPTARRQVQRAVDWMFILTLEWFGLPDSRKQHSEQLDYGFKGKSNDELRQTWMAAVVPFMEEIEIEVPAHFEPEQDRYVIDCPFPAALRRGEAGMAARGRGDRVGRGDHALARARADEPRLRAHAPARLPDDLAEARRVSATPAEHRRAGAGADLGGAAARRGSGDPGVGARARTDRVGRLPAAERTAELQITFTAMGCPATEFIEQDIRDALLERLRHRRGRDRGGLGPRVDQGPDPRQTRAPKMKRLGIVV